MYFFLLTSKTLVMQYFICSFKQINQEDKYSKMFFKKFYGFKICQYANENLKGLNNSLERFYLHWTLY